MTKRILIADDEPNILILMEQALEDLEDDYGVELLTTNNGATALEIIQQKQPQLIFLDVMMPKMSGLEVCHTIKNVYKMTDTYVILLTARGQEVDRKSGLAMGADLYLTKPFRPREVLQRSKEVLALGSREE